MVRHHILSTILEKNRKGETKRKKCRVCTVNQKRKYTIYECVACPDKPGLCVGIYFVTYHEKRNLL